MNKHYNRIALTIPDSRQVFQVVNAEKIDKKIQDWSIISLKKTLKSIHKITDLNKFRLIMLSLSKALSNHGIAPRWQGLQDACITPEQCEALTADAHIIDLFWLSVTFSKHTAINQRWQSIFVNGFDLELAMTIGERQITTAKKVRHDLSLSRFQQIGCIHFLRKSKYQTEGKLSALSLIKSRLRNSL